MVHSHVIRTMNLLTIDARKKRPKLRIFIKEKFWSHQNIKTLLSFQEKTQNLPGFSISLAHCVSRFRLSVINLETRIALRKGPKLRIFPKENFWSLQNIKTLLSFQEKSQNLPVFSISLAHCVSQLRTNFQSQKPRFSRKIGSNH